MSPATVFSAGRTALITGGANGVGLAVASLCASKGMKVALVDNNTSHLENAKKQLPDAQTYQLDVTNRDEWSGLKDKVKKQFSGIPDLLMLNAGIGLKGSWGDSDYFHKIFDVNFFGVIHGLNTFVPEIQDSKKPSAIVITGSKQGITNPPGNAAYNASKSAIKTIAEHLSFDLRDTQTSVHLLVPGWTFTGLSGNTPGTTQEKPAGAWAPEQVADYLYKKMDEGKFYVICPDNDVTPEMDKKRMTWTMGDITEERMPLSRWREDTKEMAAEALS